MIFGYNDSIIEYENQLTISFSVFIQFIHVFVSGNPHENASTLDPYKTLFIGRIVS